MYLVAVGDGTVAVELEHPSVGYLLRIIFKTRHENSDIYDPSAYYVIAQGNNDGSYQSRLTKVLGGCS